MIRAFGRFGLAVVGAVVVGTSAAALDVIGYSAAANNRFSSGFPSAPVTNTSPSFVGLPYSWLGVGWALNDPTKGFGFITPQHYLVARHYGGTPTLRLLDGSGTVFSASQASVADTGYGFVQTGMTVGDLSIGTLTAPIPSSRGLPRYGVLDLNASSTTNSSYTGQPLLVYGRGPDGAQSPRIGSASVASSTVSGSTSQITSNASSVILQSGDSGSPDFIPWTNPNGAAELTIVGNNAASDFTTTNVFNFLASSTVMGVVDDMITPNGFALKVVGTPTNTWVGSASTSIGNRSAWGLSPPSSAPSDKYVLFSGTSAGNGRAVSVDSTANLRGLYFKSTGSGTLGFTFSGSSTLTIGRGGVTNYDTSRQVFNASITLGADQYWNVGPGGVTVGAVNTGTAGYLLEIDGSGTARFTGVVSGSGALALTGGRLELSGANTATGRTWIHGGTLALSHASGLAASRVTPTVGGTLSVVGPLSATVGGLDALAGGMVNAGNGRVTVTSGLTATDLVAAIIQGRDGGTWTGAAGITSSVVASEVAGGVERAIGWVDEGAGTLAFAYAAPGDTNIDWSIDLIDVSDYLSAGRFDTGQPAVWSQGDYTYDGMVDLLDVTMYLSTGLFDAGPYNGAGAVGMIAVPEPSWLALGAGAFLMTAFSRRRATKDSPINGTFSTVFRLERFATMREHCPDRPLIADRMSAATGGCHQCEGQGWFRTSKTV